MGLFDNLVEKASKAVLDKVAETDFARNAKSTIVNKVSANFHHNSNYNKNTGYTESTLPETYNIFPKYEGTFIKVNYERKTSNYLRVSLNYSGSLNTNYITTLLSNGFIKGSSVRYDKDNIYVIVKEHSNTTEIVYHIKY